MIGRWTKRKKREVGVNRVIAETIIARQTRKKKKENDARDKESPSLPPCSDRELVPAQLD